MSKKNQYKPHDVFFKKSMSHPEIARDFFESYLPKEILEKADLTTLKRENSSFLSNELGEGVSDILYSVKFGKERGYISILLEHQSKSDKWITFRIQKYMLRLCDEELRKQAKLPEKEKKLPLIYPVVFYTGRNKYTAPRSFYELFEDEKLAKSFFTEPTKVVDVHDIKDEELKERYLDTIIYIYKHIYAKDILKHILKKLINFELIAKNNFQFLQDLLTYIVQKGETEKADEFVSVFQEMLPEDKKENVMTIAELFEKRGYEKGVLAAEMLKKQGYEKGVQSGKQEGIKEGEFRGKLEIAKKLLSSGSDIKTVSEITDLSISEIKNLID